MDARVRPTGPYYYVVQDLRLLYVDDDPILREFAAVHLAGDTTSVAVAANGAEALEMIAADKPDLVLLDLEMPVMDGFETLRRLRANPETVHLPVLVVTGREDIAAIDRAFEAGATSFATKPVNWRLLSYQARFVHRTVCNEQALLAERALVRQEERAASAALKKTVLESSHFIRAALTRHPDLRDEVKTFAEAVEDATGLGAA
ncbi:MAG: response regulator receiver protein [Caulobacteraceae bacterium]|nr:response regulator receiver protein [Caulobacteraceae bacterium]